MAASSDLQALQLQIRNLQQKLDWKQLKINQLEKKEHLLHTLLIPHEFSSQNVRNPTSKR